MLLIGLSLSFCIKDILRGRVAPEDVAFISAGTCAKDAAQWEQVLSDYARAYWYDAPILGVELAREFIDSGRIVQPRLEGLDPMPFTQGVQYGDRRLDTHWMPYTKGAGS